MVKVTYNPKHPGDPQETEWDGRKFQAGKAVEIDGRVAEHKKFIERARSNPWFDVDGETPQQQPKGEPTTAEEYRAYAINWINKSRSSSEMQRRWDDEEELRDDVGWGSDDQALIDPIFGPRLENLKAAERD